MYNSKKKHRSGAEFVIMSSLKKHQNRWEVH